MSKLPSRPSNSRRQPSVGAIGERLEQELGILVSYLGNGPKAIRRMFAPEVNQIAATFSSHKILGPLLDRITMLTEDGKEELSELEREVFDNYLRML